MSNEETQVKASPTDVSNDAVSQLISIIDSEGSKNTENNELDAEDINNQEINDQIESDENEDDAEFDTEDSNEENSESVDESEEKPTDDVYEITINGQNVQVTLDELKKGYSRDSDYRNKTMQLASDREKLQEDTNRIQQQALEGLNRAVEIIELGDPILMEGQNTDWVELANEDPAEYTRKWAEFNNRKAQVQQLYQQKREMDAQNDQARIVDETRKFVEKNPELANSQEKANEFVSDITAFLTSPEIGFTQDEVNQGLFKDHRQAQVAIMAMKWIKQEQAKNGIADKKVHKNPGKVIKPKGTTGTKPVSNKVKVAQQKFAKDRYSTDSAVELLMASTDDN